VPEYLKQPSGAAHAATESVHATVSEILAAVKREGVAALRRYSAKFDGWSPESFRVSTEEIADA
jgi:sulfopropanediol 3-dehydrogenase